MKRFLIIKTASSYDDLPDLCEKRGDEVAWFREATGLTDDDVMAVNAYKGDPFPDLEDVQAAIITGSVDMISDDLPWLEPLENWLKAAIEKQLPILGVCFGHHLLAHVLGGTVGRNPIGAEFGVVALQRSLAAADDPVFKDLPTNFEMHVFHYESVLKLPENAVLLASNEHDQNHAFRHGDNVWGVQFHPEFDAEIMAHAIDVYEADMNEAGYNASELRRHNVDNKYGRALLESFANYAST